MFTCMSTFTHYMWDHFTAEKYVSCHMQNQLCPDWLVGLSEIANQTPTTTASKQYSIPAVFKLGSTDQRGSARGLRKVVIVCTVFNNLRPSCFQICTHKSVTQCIAWKFCPG